MLFALLVVLPSPRDLPMSTPVSRGHAHGLPEDLHRGDAEWFDPAPHAALFCILPIHFCLACFASIHLFCALPAWLLLLLLLFCLPVPLVLVLMALYSVLSSLLFQTVRGDRRFA